MKAKGSHEYVTCDVLSSLVSAILPQTFLSLIILRGVYFPFLLPLPFHLWLPLSFLHLSGQSFGVGACAHDTRIEFARAADRSISFAKCHAKRRLIARGIDRVYCREFFDFDARYGTARSTVITRRNRRTLVKETTLCVNFQGRIGHGVKATLNMFSCHIFRIRYRTCRFNARRDATLFSRLLDKVIRYRRSLSEINTIAPLCYLSCWYTYIDVRIKYT